MKQLLPVIPAIVFAFLFACVLLWLVHQPTGQQYVIVRGDQIVAECGPDGCRLTGAAGPDLKIMTVEEAKHAGDN